MTERAPFYHNEGERRGKGAEPCLEQVAQERRKSQEEQACDRRDYRKGNKGPRQARAHLVVGDCDGTREMRVWGSR